jgi:peptide/nickel transport system substrate-binding protein
MTSKTGTRLLSAIVGVASFAMVLAGCSTSGNPGNDESAGGAITVGTTDRVTSIDPAIAWDQGSTAVINQIYPLLMDSPYGTSEVEPNIAVSAEFSTPTEFTVKLKPGLTFANGHDLTSSDVKFSFDRQLKISAANGPSTLLSNLESVSTPDSETVVFHLRTANDQVWPQILSSPAGPIVDEEVFSPDEATSADEIVAANAFAGQYTVTSFDLNNLMSLEANASYQGLLPKARTDAVRVKYYSSATNLTLDIQEGNIDVAWRSLAPTDIEGLRADKNVKVVDGPGGEIRYLVFNLGTQPYGDMSPNANEAKALAVRHAAAHLIDREAVAEQVYKGTFKPLYSIIPQGMTGATDVLSDLYGDGNGGPDIDKAEATLEAAGVTTPVELSLQYNGDHYGPSSGDEYAMIKSQLESSGLFAVDLQSTEWVQYVEDFTSDGYPAFQLGGFPDYPDAYNFLQALYFEGGFLGTHYDNPEVDELILKQGTTSDQDARIKLTEEIQKRVAVDLPILPLLQGAQVAITGVDIVGTSDTLDGSYKFRYAALAKK